MKTTTFFFFVLTVLKSVDGSSQVISTNVSNGNLFLSNQSYLGERRYGRLGKTNELSISQGKQLVIHGINLLPKGYGAVGSHAFVRRLYSSGKIDTLVGMAPSASFAINWNGPIIGPANLIYGLDSIIDPSLVYSELSADSDHLKTFCEFIFEIKDDPFQAASSLNANVSTASVVVPSNATGDVDVLLEQSTDMITWTQCLPGTYNASTQKRFFRVRAVEK